MPTFIIQDQLVKMIKSCKWCIQGKERVNPDLRVRLRTMNAKAVKDALIKRIVHAVRAIEKCRYQRNLLSKGRNR